MTQFVNDDGPMKVNLRHKHLSEIYVKIRVNDWKGESLYLKQRRILNSRSSQTPFHNWDQRSQWSGNRHFEELTAIEVHGVQMPLEIGL